MNTKLFFKYLAYIAKFNLKMTAGASLFAALGLVVPYYVLSGQTLLGASLYAYSGAVSLLWLHRLARGAGTPPLYQRVLVTVGGPIGLWLCGICWAEQTPEA